MNTEHRTGRIWLIAIFFCGSTCFSQGVVINATNNANATTAGQFNFFAQVGMFTTSNDEPQQVLTTAEGIIFIGGTTAPIERGKESDLGIPLTPGLRREDIFIAKVDGAVGDNTAVNWVFRAGSSKEDRFHSMLLDETGKHLYIAGRTFGAMPGTSYKGLSDLFIMKYDVTGDKPEEVWKSPLVLGTVSSDAALGLAADPVNKDVLYATGFSRGQLFEGRVSEGADDVSDAILFSFSASSASVLQSIQFGTEFGDQGVGIVVSDKPDGPIFVSVVTDRRIGQYTFGNFHLYKFKRDLTPLGDLLLRTYSREDVVGFQKHPFLRESLIVAGSSWLDTRNGNDVFVKRVVRAFNGESINSTAMDIGDVDLDEYTRRFQSSDGSHDYTTDLLIDEDSGRLVVAGHTGGEFVAGSSTKGERTPFVALIDPNDGSLTDAVQMEAETEQSWVELSAISRKPERDGVYCAFMVSNQTSKQFYVAIGTLLFPASWKERIIVKERPSPSPIVVVPQNGSDEKGIPFAIIVGAACGGFSCLALAVGCIAWVGMRKRSKSAQVFDTTLIQRPSFMNPERERPGPFIGPKTIRGRNSSGLV